MDSLRLEINGPVATLVMDRKDKYNAFTQQMWEEVPRVLGELDQHPDARVLLVRSAAPGMFCAGADVKEYRDNAGDVAWGMRSQARVARALASIRAVPVPTVAVVEGACVGGGAGIALACDIRLCSDDAFFAITPAKLGLIFPLEDTAALVALVGVAQAKQILFTGRQFDAAWALRTGLVNECHTPHGLALATDELIEHLTSVAPGSVRGMKHMIAAVQAGVSESNADTDRIVADALVGSDHLEGVTAFIERRPARFTSRPPSAAR